MMQEAFSRMDAEILDKSRASGRLDGTTALAAVHVGPVLSVANAGESSRSRRVALCLLLPRGERPASFQDPTLGK